MRPEPESAALLAWLDTRPDDVLLSSRLLIVELHRALRRSAAEPDVLAAADELLGQLYLRDLDPVVGAAADLHGDHLRSLDALHLATALQTTSAGHGGPVFVTYDTRLAESAQQAGLTVHAPA